MSLPDSNSSSNPVDVCRGDADAQPCGVCGEAAPCEYDDTLTESNPRKRREALEAEVRKFLDWADENADEGGHVGFSRYYRQRAREIECEMRLADSNPSNRLYGTLTLDEVKQRALRIEWEPATNWEHDWLGDFAIAVYALANSLTYDSPFSEEEANPRWKVNAEISGTME